MMMRTSSIQFVASSLAVLSLAASCSLRTSAPPPAADVAERLGRVAVPFVANAGQSDPRVAYYAPTFSGTVFVTGEGDLVYALPAPGHRAEAADRQEPASGWTLTESFVDGHPTPVGAHPAATHVSVFASNDPARWQRDVASYADVDLGAVWPGISVALTAHGKQVEKVFTVEPGAMPDAIRVRVAGAESLAPAADRGLLLHTGAGHVRLPPPVASQGRGGCFRRNTRSPATSMGFACAATTRPSRSRSTRCSRRRISAAAATTRRSPSRSDQRATSTWRAARPPSTSPARAPAHSPASAAAPKMRSSRG